MAAPTRAEIEAVVTHPAYTVEYWSGGAWTALDAALVLEVSGAAESAGGENGLAFGATATARATLALDSGASSIAWERARMRVRFGFDASDRLVRTAGLATRRSRDTDGGVTLDLAGFDEAIARTPVYSPLFHRRPGSTATSASSVEDPASASYQAGLVNYIFWQAGGRPLAQAASYPDALFFYQCDTALIAPEWSWCVGENAWDELGRIACACGLVIFQAADGTMTAQHALTLAGSGSYTFVRGVYADIQEEATVGELIAAARCRYTTRRLQPEQVVYEDTVPRIVAVLSSISLTLEMQQPVLSYVLSGSALPPDAITATTAEGTTVTLSAAVTQQAAARLALTITNAGSATLTISRIQIRGRPIAPTEEGMVVVGSGVPEREIGSDAGVYVQSRGHARMLAALYRDVYGLVRPTRTLRDCGYDPDRYVGEAVRLTDAALGLVDAPHRITAIRHTETGSRMDVDLVPTDGLPTLADVFVIGQTYAAGSTRKLSY